MIDTVPMDAVSVCTYNCSHAECTIYALEHGLHVLLEKPMTVTLDEAVAICRAEKKSGKIVSVGFQPRYDANMQMIKKLSSRENWARFTTFKQEAAAAMVYRSVGPKPL